MGNPMLGQLTVLRSLVTFAADTVCITITKINWQWCSLKKHMIWYALSLSSVVWVIWLKQSEWSKVNTRASLNRENSIWNYSRQAYIRSVKVGTGEVKINQDWPRFAKIVESEAEGDDGEVVSLWWSEEVRVGPTKFCITRPQQNMVRNLRIQSTIFGTCLLFEKSHYQELPPPDPQSTRLEKSCRMH